MENTKPIKKFRNGNLSVSIWENKTTNDKKEEIIFNTFTFQRSYKNNKGEWENTNTLMKNDILRLSNLLKVAYEDCVIKVE